MTKLLEWQGLELHLLAHKVLYIPKYAMIVLSDWHLGKLGHFRQEGLFVPPMRSKDELDRLGFLFNTLEVERVVFLGDLFHSNWNYEWNEFVTYIQQFPNIEFILTKGNHDLLPDILLAQSPLKIKDYLWLNGGVILSHEPLADISDSVLNIVGHIHPGVEIQSKGRQRFRLACFYLEHNVLTLPAFGRWTGLYLIKKNMDNRLFAIVGHDVVEV